MDTAYRAMCIPENKIAEHLSKREVSMEMKQNFIIRIREFFRFEKAEETNG